MPVPAEDEWRRITSLRADQRAQFVEAWAKQGRPERDIESLQDEIDTRLAYWRPTLRPPARRPSHDAQGRLVIPRTLEHFAAYLVIYILIGSAVTCLGGPTLAIVACVIGCLLLPVAIFAAKRKRGRSLLARAIVDHTCPACEYDLSGLMADEVGGRGLLRIGPANCPECGAPWPLVPPPVPKEKPATPIAT